MIYTIKPLEWEGDKLAGYNTLVAYTPFGSYQIVKGIMKVYLDTPDEVELTTDSVEHAKELAWQDWTKQLEGALTPCVITTSQSPELKTTSAFPISFKLGN